MSTISRGASAKHLTRCCRGVNSRVVHPYRAGDLEITVVESDDPPRVFLGCEGRSIEREPRLTLGVFLTGALSRAMARGSEIELQCQRLTYINSATISCLVEFIRRCNSERVRLTLRFDGSSAWQRSCFNALRVLAKDDNRLTIAQANER